MADKTILMLDANGGAVPLKAVDNGDGTYSLKVTGISISGSGSGGLVDGSVSDASGTITAGGSDQQVLTANLTRAYLFIGNPSTETESLWINFGGAAAVGGASSIELLPGEKREFPQGLFVATDSLHVTAATIGHKFTCKIG